MPELPPTPLFVYGTLIFGEVIDRVIGRRPLDVRRAAAPSWSARVIPGATYPGLVPDQLSAAGGLLLGDLSAAELAALDEYEGAEYVRAPIEVVDDRGKVVAAQTYLVDPALVGDEVWTSRWFFDEHLEAFLAMLDAER